MDDTYYVDLQSVTYICPYTKTLVQLENALVSVSDEWGGNAELGDVYLGRGDYQFIERCPTSEQGAPEHWHAIRP